MAHRGPNIVWSDADILDALWRRDALGHSAAVIATTLGVTRNAVLGALHRIDRAGAAFDWDALADCTLLSVLDEFHGRGTSAEDLAARLRCPRHAVLHMVHTIRLDLARSNGPEAAQVPGNRDGDLPLGWWALAGAEARAARAGGAA